MANQISDAERYQLRERLMRGINTPLQDPIFREVEESQRWNPEAMTEERLAEFQKIGWFKGYEFNPEVYEQHKKELYAAQDRTYPEPEPTPEQKAKDLDPMNGIRKAAKDGDWTSMMVEYAANKAGLGGLLAQQQQKPPQKQPQKSSGFGKL